MGHLRIDRFDGPRLPGCTHLQQASSPRGEPSLSYPKRLRSIATSAMKPSEGEQRHMIRELDPLLTQRELPVEQICLGRELGAAGEDVVDIAAREVNDV